VIRCRIGSVVRRGAAVTIEQQVEPATVADAVRAPGTTVGRVVVDAPTPTELFDHVGHIHPEMGLRTRTALARAARTRGLETPEDEALERAIEERAEVPPPEDGDGLAAARETVAELRAETDRLRERVATLRGRLQEAREQGRETTAPASDLEAAIRELSEAETERAAARQRLERARQETRARRARHEQLRRLDDRIANHRRAARAYLVDQMAEAFAAAVATVPWCDPGDDPFAAGPVSAGLAIARLGASDAPVVLDCDRFASAAAAADWLGRPVLKV